jgi:hypothetical protein
MQPGSTSYFCFRMWLIQKGALQVVGAPVFLEILHDDKDIGKT